VPIIISVLAIHTQIVTRGLVTFNILVSEFAAEGKIIRQGKIQGAVEIVSTTVFSIKIRRIILPGSEGRLKKNVCKGVS
jgi:hypothetical protein